MSFLNILFTIGAGFGFKAYLDRKNSNINYYNDPEVTKIDARINKIT